jgi:hydroxyacylglutathione hydrolase
MPDPSGYLNQLELGPMQNYTYLIGDPETRRAAIVDPGWEPDKILAVLRRDGYEPAAVFLTHQHFDHVQAVPQLLNAVDMPVYIHEGDKPFVTLDPTSLKAVQGGDVLDVGAKKIQIIHTPGHTPGSMCLLMDGCVFTGDTLFINACGRTDLPGGNAKQLWHSLTKILGGLPDDTIVLTGHNYAPEPTSTIAKEKQNNPFMKMPDVNAFLRMLRLPEDR